MIFVLNHQEKKINQSIYFNIPFLNTFLVSDTMLSIRETNTSKIVFLPLTTSSLFTITLVQLSLVNILVKFIKGTKEGLFKQLYWSENSCIRTRFLVKFMINSCFHKKKGPELVYFYWILVELTKQK